MFILADKQNAIPRMRSSDKSTNEQENRKTKYIKEKHIKDKGSVALN